MRGGDDSRTPGQQAAHNLGGDGARGDARDDGDIAGEAGCRRVCLRVSKRLGGDGVEDRGEVAAILLLGLGGEPLGLLADRISGAGEVQLRDRPVVVVVQAGEVLTGGSPAVVEFDGLAGIEARFDLLGPISAEFRGDGLDNRLIVVIFRLGCRGVQAEPVEHVTGGGCEHASGTGDLLGEGVKRGGIDHRTRGGAGSGRQRDRDIAACGHLLDSGIDKRIGGGLVLGGFGTERRQIPATRGRPVTRAKHERDEHMGCPAFSELPRIGHPLFYLGLLDAGRTEQMADAVAHDIAKDLAEGLVIRGDLVNQLAQRRDRRFGGAIDAGHAEFGADIHKQLVAARGDAVGERVGRVVVANLVGADLARVGEQRGDCVGGMEWQISWAFAGCGGRGRRSRDGRNSSRSGGLRCRSSRSSSRGGHRSGAVFLGVGFDERISVGHVDATLITPHVVHGHMAAGVLRQAQGLRAEVRERRGVAQTDLDVFLNAEPVMRSSAEHEVLRLNPTHRAGELPG